MSKRPPSRRGITFEVGARLEARDRLKKWYTAHIEKIDYDEGKVLIHFKRWNHRYDEWFNWDSVYLRPLERPLLRKEGAKLDEPTVEFRPGEQVLACWSDCRFYPAKVISVNKDASYTVEFYDGVIQNVKKIHVKSLPKSSREKNAASGRNKENGTASARRRERFRERFSPSLASQQVGEDKPVVIEEEGEVVKLAGEAPGQLGKAAEVPAAAEKKSPAQSSPPGSPPPAVPPSKPEEKRKRGRPPSVGLAGGHSKGAASQDRRLLPARQGGSGTGKRKCASAASTLSKQMKLDQGQTAGSQEQSRRRSLRLASGDSNSSAASVPSEGTEARSRAKEQDCAAEAAAAAPATETPAQAQQEPTIQAQSSTDAAPNTSVPTVLASPEQQLKEAAKVDSPEPGSEPRDPPPEAAPVVKRVPRSQNPNRYSREPLTNTAQSPEEQLPPKALIIDLDHNKFKCKIAECSKAFRKAKMLHYHMKYYHGIEKAESEQGSPKRSMQTRGSCASETESLLDSPKRRRTTSGSLHGSQNVSLRDAHTSSVDPRAARLNEKRRISAPSSLDVAAQSRLSLREKARDNQTERSHRKLQDRERGFTDSGMKEKNKEKKVRDFLKVKLKKKKKKKKKVKSELSDSEENIDVSRDCPPKKSTFLSTRSSSSYKFPFSHKYTTLCTSDSGYLMEGLTFDDVSDEDSTSDSSTDSLLWSEDEYSQEVDVTTNAYDTGDGEDSQLEIVRCICEVEEENEFMIQCEECLCWQHGVCMGLLEDSVPEVYTCYVCRDPPGEPQAAAGLQPSTCLVDKQPAFSPRPYTFVPRGAPPAVDLEGECTVSAAHEHRLSSRYWYDKEWLSSGHMHGLTFLKENYSHQNSGNIVATHQLLGDVHRVIEVLHGLQLKIYILQNKDQPDLKLWSKPWRVNSTAIEKLRERHSAPSEDSNSGLSASAPGRTPNGTSERQNRVPVIEESYITSEHCYQKPRAYYPAAEQRLVVETRNSSLDEGFGRMRENGDETLAERFGRNVDEDSGRPDYDFRREQDSVCKDESGTGKVHGSGPAAEPQGEQESRGPRQGEEGGAGDPQLQWQVNLLAHVESLQDEACHRMDFIERELDVLESWLDYSGELEPPDPLARLPQLKNRMKQLLADLGKVQQIASYCPV